MAGPANALAICLRRHRNNDNVRGATPFEDL